MIFIAEFVQFIEFVWSNFTAVFFTGVAGGFVAGLLHLWTRRVHEANKAPNWTLLKLCNTLCIVVSYIHSLKLCVCTC